MTFHSLDFVAFLVLVTAIYWRLSHGAQNWFLLGASYLFYGWIHPWFCLLLATTTVVDWYAGLAMQRRPGQRRRWLVLSVLANLGMLGFFKYYNFFAANVHQILDSVGMATSFPVLQVALPVGISFYTFQSLSYSIDVYRGRLQPTPSLRDFALFVSFFPQLVAGPIERALSLLPRVQRPRQFNLVVARDALVLLGWGFFKKLVIADNVGIVANRVFALNEPSFEILWAGVFAFGIQIYADFSAYTDIARGTARWLGFELMKNFNHPYLATSPSDFWRRWHISLSSWFRDYLYIPLGGSRHGTPRTLVNIFITFLVSGLWHGAAWNFVFWGAFHGILLMVQRVWGLLRGRPRHQHRPPWWQAVPQWAVMFLLVNVGWLMFRESDTDMLLRHLTLLPGGSTPLEQRTGLYLFLLTLTFSVPLWAHSLWTVWRGHSYTERRAVTEADVPPRLVVLQAVAVGLMFMAILALRSRTTLDFIYFQF
jgi:alginate O-acetyltransferase complex protein AlgI